MHSSASQWKARRRSLSLFMSQRMESAAEVLGICRCLMIISSTSSPLSTGQMTVREACSPACSLCLWAPLTRAAVQNSIDCLSLQLSTSSLADVQEFLATTDPLFLNDGPSTIASNTQVSASNYAADRSLDRDCVAAGAYNAQSNCYSAIASLKEAAAHVATARDAECGYRSAVKSRKPKDAQPPQKSKSRRC